MDKTIAILFLEFRELVSQQIIDLSSTLMRHDFEVRNQREELSFLKKQIDHLSRKDVDIDSLLAWLIKDIEKEVLNESSGCSSCSGPKAFKAKNKSNEN